MTNERLRSQIAASGLSIEGLANRLQVAPKTVERWITRERLPRQRLRWAAAEVLGAEEGYLWPAVLNDVRTQSASRAELVDLYPHRGAVPNDLWGRWIDGADDSIDVLVYAGQFLVDILPDLAHTLRTKAERGLRVRMLLGEPSADVIQARGGEEGSGSDLAARVRLTLSELQPMLGTEGAELRLHSTVLYNSIYRFDEDLLANVHVYGTAAAHNPVIHLHRVPGGRLFDTFMRSFERVWETAEPFEAPAKL